MATSVVSLSFIDAVIVLRSDNGTCPSIYDLLFFIHYNKKKKKKSFQTFYFFVLFTLFFYWRHRESNWFLRQKRKKTDILVSWLPPLNIWIIVLFCCFFSQFSDLCFFFQSKQKKKPFKKMKRRLSCNWLLLAAILIQVRKQQHSTTCFSTLRLCCVWRLEIRSTQGSFLNAVRTYRIDTAHKGGRLLRALLERRWT